MEKMNQVSVSEFFAKSKEEMYDMAVEMVEKYNRLIDICNDGSERIAELVIERDNLSKGVQKLIGERDELTERHNVYTNALNNDIAEKAAKIELLEKEIEGRKEGYWALKEKMDTQYISIDDHNDVCKAYEKKVVELKKEIEKWQDLAKMNRDTICDQYGVCEEFKKKITELEEMTRYWESQYEYVLKCRKEDIEDLEGRLKEEIDLVRSAEERLVELQKENEELENTVKKLNKELADCKVKIRHQKENLDGINKTLEIRTKENESLIKVRNNLNKEIEAHESENARLSERIIELKKERDKHMARVNDLRMELDCIKASKEKHEEAARDKTIEDMRESINYWRTQCLAAQEARDAFMKENTYLKKELDNSYKAWDTDSKNHQKRDMTLVDELGKKNDKIKALVQEIEYYKGQERIRTDQLRATESKVDELWRLNNELKKEVDDYAKSGFKLYVKNTLAEAEGDKNEANEVITEAVRSAYAEWGKEQKEKEEETEVKGNGRTSSGRYPWGAKVNDIPCGEDAIE